MSRWRIDTHRTSFRVSFQPGMPGLGVQIRGVTGTLYADLDERGQPDLNQPVEGTFELTLDDLRLGNALLTRAARSWLGDEDQVAMTGWMGDVEPLGDDNYRFEVRLRMRGDEHPLEAHGRTALQPDGSVQVHGTSEVDPRRLGVALPRFVPLRCRTLWDLRVLPDD